MHILSKSNTDYMMELKREREKTSHIPIVS
jgi:hypothetical protein